MPRGDHTGPMGRGPKTGRGFGYCAGYGMPGYASSFSQGGRRAAFAGDFGTGRGGYGRRLRRGFNPHCFSGWGQYYDSPDFYDIPMAAPVPDPEAERRLLQDQGRVLQTQLDLIHKRLNVLEKKETKGDQEE